MSFACTPDSLQEVHTKWQVTDRLELVASRGGLRIKHWLKPGNQEIFLCQQSCARAKRESRSKPVIERKGFLLTRHFYTNLHIQEKYLWYLVRPSGAIELVKVFFEDSSLFQCWGLWYFHILKNQFSPILISNHFKKYSHSTYPQMYNL